MATEDPKKMLTSWLTEGFGKGEGKEHLDRTRLMVKGQKEWYLACLSLDDPFFMRMIEADQMLMMGYKGRRSDDVVIALSHLEEQDAQDAGLQPLKDILKDKRRNR